MLKKEKLSNDVILTKLLLNKSCIVFQEIADFNNIFLTKILLWPLLKSSHKTPSLVTMRFIILFVQILEKRMLFCTAIYLTWVYPRKTSHLCGFCMNATLVLNWLIYYHLFFELLNYVLPFYHMPTPKKY